MKTISENFNLWSILYAYGITFEEVDMPGLKWNVVELQEQPDTSSWLRVQIAVKIQHHLF